MQLGFDAQSTEYERYMASEEWAAKRAERLKIDDYRCHVCGKRTNIQVHHLTYERFRHEDVESDLITLCRECHKAEHKKAEIAAEYDALRQAFCADCDRLSTGLFGIYAWDKDVMNGGDENLSSTVTVARLRDEFIEKYTDNTHHFRISSLGFSQWFSHYKGLVVIEKLLDGKTVAQISREVGLSEKAIYKRRAKLKKVNWVEVDEATDFERLPQGGYVLEIVDVEDQPEYERLGVIFDVAEGEQSHKFANTAPDMAWTHRLTQSYKDTAARFFKGFLSALEQSNPGFSVAEWQKESDETKLIGLKFGAVINYWVDVNEKGVLTRRYNLARALPVDKIRSGDFKVPDDRYSDEAKAQAEAEAKSEYEAPVPF